MMYDEVNEVNIKFIDSVNEDVKIEINDNDYLFTVLKNELKDIYDIDDEDEDIIDVFVDNVDNLLYYEDDDVNNISLLSYSTICLKDIILLFKVLSIKEISFKDDNKEYNLRLKDLLNDIFKSIYKDDNDYIKRHIIKINNSLYNIDDNLLIYFFDEIDFKDNINDLNFFDVFDNIDIDDLKDFKLNLNEDDIYFYKDNQYYLWHNIKLSCINEIIDDDYFYDVLNYIEDEDIDDLYNFFDDLIFEINEIEIDIKDNDDVLYYY